MKLERYLGVSKDIIPAKFIISKSIEVENFEDLEINELWEIHNRTLKKVDFNKFDFYDIEYVSPNLLDLKIEIAKRIFENCKFCEHRCYVNRKIERGFCRIKESYYSTEFLHFGEERVLIPSHTIFFCGCNFKCVFCQNWDISQVYFDRSIINRCIPYNPKKIANIIEDKRIYSKNVNFVGGEPTPNLLSILKTLKYLNRNIPVVWNSNMYLTVESLNLLKGVVDVFLTDFKFGNNKCGERLSKVKNYFDIVGRNHILIKDEEVIIRHLVLPNHIDCCTEKIFQFISNNLYNAVVNVMFQYRPEYKAKEYPDINRILNYEEIERVIYLVEKYNLDVISD
ncbi:radical SAM protein [Methanocaldococcus sp.]|uniref:radical SAM protein n=1 Tax=Methanocaldococcus sp. TaxID=2152917 RepID=UPI002625B2B3|nr:radical SAM protein [Methanocaldococcus sp.]MCQ6254367.1 radical SAM protein [Methanocaldococcus sp.]